MLSASAIVVSVASCCACSDSRLVLDSWTRPTYAKLAGRKTADRTIERKFRRYGDFAGLAFWLLLTRGWVPE